MRTSWTGESSSPRVTFVSNWSAVQTMPPPAPPIVNDGRMTTGWKPSWLPASSWAISLASRSDFATRLRAWSIPTRSMRSRNAWRSSVMWMASMSTPITSIPLALPVPLLVERVGEVEGRLAAHRREHGVGPLLGDDLLDRRRA